MPIPQLVRRVDELDEEIEELYQSIQEAASRDDKAEVERLTDEAAARVLDYYAVRCELMTAESEPV